MSKTGQLFNLKQAGDTIVEVAIAIAVISTILTGAFVVTNRSLTAVRDSEEHSVALGLLQGQVEQLRNAATNTSDNSYLTSTNPFCFDTNGNIVTSCTTVDNLYNLSIQQCSSSLGCTSADNLTTPYLLTVAWNGLGGVADKEQITYRVQVT
jgi:uncharacterized protein (TIGR02598 family)